MKQISVALTSSFLSLLLAFSISAQGNEEPAKAANEPSRADLMARGQQIAGAVCVACHGIDGNSPIPANPNIAGHPEQYIAAQLADFKAGKRLNPVMQGMVANLSADDMKALGVFYYAQKPNSVATARDKTIAEKGQKIYRAGIVDQKVPACAGCHGGAGAGIPAKYPRLSGQHPSYTLAALEAYANGSRKNAVMQSIASRLKPADLQAVAEYAAGMYLR